MGYRVRFDWELPESLLEVVLPKEAKVAEEMKRAAVLDWVRTKKISWRKGAELLELSYRDFLKLMTEHDVPTLDIEEGELEKELAALKKVRQEDER